MAKVKNFVAHYMPAHDGEDPSMSGFKTEDAAWNWIRNNHICKSCRVDVETHKKWIASGKKYPPKSFFKSLQDEVDWSHENIGDNHPACMCEWMVLEKDKLNKCKDFGDIMDAVGAKKI